MIPLVVLLFPVKVYPGTLDPVTLNAWEEYIQSANLRTERGQSSGKAFLWMDEAPDRIARVRAGEIIVLPIGNQNPKRVRFGLIHDWVGAVFIPRVTISDLLAVLSDYSRYKDFYKPTVVDSRVISTSETKDRFSIRLVNKSYFLKSALDADYESCHVHVDDQRGYSISRTTRVQEIEEYGERAERVLHEGEGSGIIWRLFGIVRYVERDGGVYLELEVIGLSRDIPASLQWVIDPIVRRISQGSLSTMLRQTASVVRSRAALASHATGSRVTAVAGHEGSATKDLHASRSDLDQSDSASAGARACSQ